MIASAAGLPRSETAPKKIKSSERKGERCHVRHERASSRNGQWRKCVKNKRVRGRPFIECAPNKCE